MFATGTQKQHWMFSGETEINKLRTEANERFIAEHGKGKDPKEIEMTFLTNAEEKLMMRHFEFILREFCKKFTPTMPKYVQGTALMYFKRVYVHSSIMDLHPRDLMSAFKSVSQPLSHLHPPPLDNIISYWSTTETNIPLTCVYLACKVEEFNVSIGQFVGNLKGDREKFADIIIGFELLLMDRLHYHLTVHNPFRPLEGFIIDIKTRFYENQQAAAVEKLRRDAEDFIERILATDACLVFSPSQIALAALVSSAAKEEMNLDSYVSKFVVDLSRFPEQGQKVIYAVKRIKYMLKSQEPLQRDQIGAVQRKLEHCRNQENNPESEIYKRKLEEMFDDEEEVRSRKRARIAEEEKQAEKSLMGM